MKHFTIALLALFMLGGCIIIDAEETVLAPSPVGVADAASSETAIRAVLTRQAAAWNRGDIDAFMQDYWKSEQLRFASGGTVTHGWQATIDRYKTRYGDRAAMGTLTFDGLDVDVLAPDAAIVHGQWALARAGDRPSGLYTLVFRNFGEGWVIVSDTTTSAAGE